MLDKLLSFAKVAPDTADIATGQERVTDLDIVNANVSNNVSSTSTNTPRK